METLNEQQLEWQLRDSKEVMITEKDSRYRKWLNLAIERLFTATLVTAGPYFEDSKAEKKIYTQLQKAAGSAAITDSKIVF